MAVLWLALRRERWTMLGWSVCLAFLAFAAMASYPAFAESDEFDRIWQDFPQAARNLFGGAASIATLEGFLDSQLLSFLPLLLGIQGLLQASRLAGDEESGWLDLWLATPLARTHWLAAQTAAIVIALAVSCTAIGGAFAIAAVSVNAEAPMLRLALAPFDALPAAYFFCAVALFAGGVLHQRRPVQVAAAAVLVTSFFVAGLAPLRAATAPLRWGSAFYHYNQSRPLSTGPDPLYYGVFLALAILLTVAAAGFYQRKNLTG